MRNEFEAAVSGLIEVDPYRRPIRNPTHIADVSAVAGRGSNGYRSSFSSQRRISFFNTRPTKGSEGVAKDERWTEIEKEILHVEFK